MTSDNHRNQPNKREVLQPTLVIFFVNDKKGIFRVWVPNLKWWPNWLALRADMLVAFGPFQGTLLVIFFHHWTLCCSPPPCHKGIHWLGYFFLSAHPTHHASIGGTNFRFHQLGTFCPSILRVLIGREICARRSWLLKIMCLLWAYMCTIVDCSLSFFFPLLFSWLWMCDFYIYYFVGLFVQFSQINYMYILLCTTCHVHI